MLETHHFRACAPEHIDYAIDRYTNEASRLYGVLDTRLASHAYLAGEYSIADRQRTGPVSDREREIRFAALRYKRH